MPVAHIDILVEALVLIDVHVYPLWQNSTHNLSSIVHLCCNRPLAVASPMVRRAISTACTSAASAVI